MGIANALLVDGPLVFVLGMMMKTVVNFNFDAAGKRTLPIRKEYLPSWNKRSWGNNTTPFHIQRSSYRQTRIDQNLKECFYLVLGCSQIMARAIPYVNVLHAQTPNPSTPKRP
ncbi:hypothetical protein M404DRAFT_366925 [Pisolithus tinctorius Marx 270]|uniref:Uncharacterized protein n=1 Tax=Pisolithus tinctorius Marx 270 TaxID=870435 RepID=A0A0C3KG99_PISTI|nr:hypothetical protein M404DRAFT_366925 [Pisolithus tinctorius Marx 270]